jgi:hypothetical protein
MGRAIAVSQWRSCYLRLCTHFTTSSSFVLRIFVFNTNAQDHRRQTSDILMSPTRSSCLLGVIQAGQLPRGADASLSLHALVDITTVQDHSGETIHSSHHHTAHELPQSYRALCSLYACPFRYREWVATSGRIDSASFGRLDYRSSKTCSVDSPYMYGPFEPVRLGEYCFASV